MVARAAVLQRKQSGLQSIEVRNALIDVGNVRADRLVHERKVIGPRFAQMHQPLDFLKSYPEKSAVTDKVQARKVLFGVVAVVVGKAQRLGQQALCFVKADRFHGHARFLGKFSDAHVCLLTVCLTL